MKNIYLLIFTLFLSFFAKAQLDPNFGDNGIVINNYGVGNVAISGAITDVDGRVVTIGYNRWQHPYYSDVLIRRFLQDGQVDSSFGDNGHKILDIGDNDRNRGFIKIDGEGRYIFGVSVSGSVVIGRMFRNGSMDESFAEQGFYRLKLPVFLTQSGSDLLEDIFVGADNSITAAVQSSTSTFFPPIFSLAQAYFRLQPDGQPDPTFGEEGLILDIVQEDGYGFYSRQEGDRTMKFDENGNAFRIRAQNTFTGGAVFIEKRLPTGDIDPAFGDNGLVDIIPLIPAGLEHFTIDQKGGVIFVGVSEDYESKILFRLLPEGKLDESWGRGDGYVEISDAIRNLYGILTYKDQLILYGDKDRGVVPGSSDDASMMSAVFLNDSGMLQSTIGENGRVFVRWDNYDQRAMYMLVNGNDHLLMMGAVSDYSRDAMDQALVLLRPDGQLDESFGDKGKISHMGIENETFIRSFVPLSDGSIIIGGGANNSIGWNYFVTKHLSNGDLDPSFGTEGTIYTPDRSIKTDVAVIGEHRDLSVLLVEKFPDLPKSVFIKRLLVNGSFDQQWANRTGAIILPDTELAYHFELMPDLSLRTVSVDDNNADAKQLVFRQFTPDGLPDFNFGSEGKTSIVFPGAGRLTPFNIYYLGSRIMYVGYVPDRAEPTVLMLVGNIPDTTFGQAGHVALTSSQNGYRTAKPDHLGNVYLLGREWGTTWSKIKKLQPNGQPYLSFGVNGEYISSNFGDFNRPFLTDIISDVDGSLYLIGSIRNVDNPVFQESLSVVRLSTAGVPDGDFGLNELPISPFYLTNIMPAISKVDNKLMIAGNRATISRARYFFTRWDMTINSKAFTAAQNKQKLSFKVFPNPASTQLMIVSPQKWSPDARIQIWDMSGRKALDTKVGLESHLGQAIDYQLDLPLDLPSGMYILTLQNDSITLIEKFIKH